MNICQKWSTIFLMLFVTVSMKAKNPVFCLFRLFFHLSCKIQIFFMPLPHVTHCHTAFQDLSSFLFALQSLPPSLLSQYMLFKSWIWERGKPSHSLCRKLLLRSCPFSCCTLLSKLNKECETVAGKGSLYLIFSPALQCGCKSSQGGVPISWIFYSIALAS